MPGEYASGKSTSPLFTFSFGELLWRRNSEVSRKEERIIGLTKRWARKGAKLPIGLVYLAEMLQPSGLWCTVQASTTYTVTSRCVILAIRNTITDGAQKNELRYQNGPDAIGKKPLLNLEIP